jgi:hypothetical protein
VSRLTTTRLEELARDRMIGTAPTALHGHPSYVATCALCRAERDALVLRLYPPRRQSTVFVNVEDCRPSLGAHRRG